MDHSFVHKAMGHLFVHKPMDHSFVDEVQKALNYSFVTNHVEMRDVLQKSLLSKQRSKSRPGQYIVNIRVKIDFRFFAFLERLSIRESPVRRNFSSDVCKS